MSLRLMEVFPRRYEYRGWKGLGFAAVWTGLVTANIAYQAAGWGGSFCYNVLCHHSFRFDVAHRVGYVDHFGDASRY
jgi:hypothetical protein